MLTGPVGPVEVVFYLPEAVFGNFYWPGAIGLPLASSPGLYLCNRIIVLSQEKIYTGVFRDKDSFEIPFITIIL